MNPLTDFYLPEEFLAWQDWLFFGVALLVLLLGASAYARFRKIRLTHELSEQDNPALAISFTGFLVALVLILTAVLQSSDPDDFSLKQSLLSSFLWTLGGLALLLTSLVVNDRILFPRFDNRKEIITDRNPGLAVVEAATFIGTALIIRGSLSTQLGPSPIPEPWLTLLYFVLGQSLFLLFCRLYPKTSRIEIHRELEEDNPAVGLAFAGALLAFAWLLAEAKMNHDSFPVILALGLFYLAVLSLARAALHYLLAHRFSLKDELVRDRNWGLGLTEAALTLALAAVLTVAL